MAWNLTMVRQHWHPTLTSETMTRLCQGTGHCNALRKYSEKSFADTGKNSCYLVLLESGWGGTSAWADDLLFGHPKDVFSVSLYSSFYPHLLILPILPSFCRCICFAFPHRCASKSKPEKKYNQTWRWRRFEARKKPHVTFNDVDASQSSRERVRGKWKMYTQILMFFRGQRKKHESKVANWNDSWMLDVQSIRNRIRNKQQQSASAWNGSAENAEKKTRITTKRCFPSSIGWGGVDHVFVRLAYVTTLWIVIAIGHRHWRRQHKTHRSFVNRNNEQNNNKKIEIELQQRWRATTTEIVHKNKRWRHKTTKKIKIEKMMIYLVLCKRDGINAVESHPDGQEKDTKIDFETFFILLSLENSEMSKRKDFNRLKQREAKRSTKRPRERERKRGRKSNAILISNERRTSICSRCSKFRKWQTENSCHQSRRRIFSFSLFVDRHRQTFSYFSSDLFFFLPLFLSLLFHSFRLLSFALTIFFP